MVHRNSLFWGVLLVLFGGLLLLNTLGILSIHVWNLIWPLFLIMLGAWVLLGVLIRPSDRDRVAENAVIPLDDARQAVIQIHHGAGQLIIGDGTDPGTLVQGSFGGGLDYRRSGTGGQVNLDLRPRHDGSVMWGFPWIWPSRGYLDWNLTLARDIPLKLRLETGASESRVNLTDLCVEDLNLHTGASSTELTMPVHAGFTSAKLEAGAASVNVHIPGGVAARIRTSGGLSSISVDTSRFPRQDGVYTSPDYSTAQNKVDLTIEIGAGSARVY